MGLLGSKIKKALKVTLPLVLGLFFLLSLFIGNSDAATLQIDSTSPLPTASELVAYATSLQASGGTAPYTWSFTSGTMPAGLVLGVTDGIISGITPPGTKGLYNFTIQVQDSLSATDTRSFDLRVTDLVITISSLPWGPEGIAYSFPLMAAGGTPPYAWSIGAGVLPDGLWLDSSTGLINGTPEFKGVYTFRISVQDSLSVVVTKLFTIAIGDLEITSTVALPTAREGGSYTYNLVGVGGLTPYTWTYIGSIPSGLNFQSNGTITGTPDASTEGVYTFDAELMDVLGYKAKRTFILPVEDDNSITITPDTLPDALAGALYSQSLSASGGNPSYTWSISSGSLPTGLSLNSGTGLINGTPASDGEYTFAVRVDDSGGASEMKAYTLNVNGLRILNQGLSDPIFLSPYSENLFAAGGTPPYTWTKVGGTILPALNLSSSGVLWGTPVWDETMTFTAKATDANGLITITKPFTLSTATIKMDEAPLPEGIQGQAYSTRIKLSGGSAPYSFDVSSGTLPTGLYLDLDSGHVLGYPSATGTYTFAITVYDDADYVVAQIDREITIASSSGVYIETTELSPASEAYMYSQYLQVSGGTAPYTWSLPSGTLPSGLTFYMDGHIEGTPSVATRGHYNITVQVQDSLANTYSRQFSMRVSDLKISTAFLSDGALGVPFKQDVDTQGGSKINTWSVIEGILPEGLMLHKHTGTIYGTPNLMGTYPFILQVEDSIGYKAQQIFSITISDFNIITSSALPSLQEGAYYMNFIEVEGGLSPYFWSFAGALPSGMNFLGGYNGAAVVNGTPAPGSEGNYIIMAIVTDDSARGASKEISLRVNAASTLNITEVSIPDALAGVSYSETLTAIGGTPPYTWSGSMLPDGLTIDPSGQLQGKPIEAGEYTIFALVQDSVANEFARYYDLKVSGVKVDTGSLPYATFLAPYNSSLTASGGTAPYTWSVASGKLPAGLTLDPFTGDISGIVNSIGTEKFKVSVFDTNGSVSSRPLKLKVYNAQVMTESVPDAASGVPYNKTLMSMGGSFPYTWSVADGALPTGITLSQGGTLSGTPTINGYNDFILKLVDGNGATDYRAFAISVGDLAIDNENPLPTASEQMYYQENLLVSGGAAPFTWILSSGSLPVGLTHSVLGGFINGTPQIGSMGSWQFEITVQDSFSNTVSKDFSLTVSDMLITTSNLTAGQMGNPYSAQIQAAGGSGIYTFYKYSGTLPPGLTIHPNLGTLYGTPTQEGNFSFTVSVVDHTGNMSQKAFNVYITDLDIIETSPLPGAPEAQYYSQNLTGSGGTAPYTWNWSGVLPSGMSFSGGVGSSALINGTPNAATEGNYKITAYLTDSLGIMVSEEFVLSVNTLVLSDITGSLRNRMGLSVPYAPVKLQKSGGGTIMGSADINGNFSFAGLVDGEYKITTRLMGYRFRPVLVTVSGFDQNVTITSDMSLWDMKRAEKYLTDSTAPGMPSGLIVNALSPSVVEVKWNVPPDNVGVSGYRIFDGGGSFIATSVMNMFRATGLNSSTLYCFKVTAFDGVGNESTQSSQVCDTTP